MVIERPEAGKTFPPLPVHQTQIERAALPTTNGQMEQLSKQLTQLMEQLQRLNHQMQISHENKISTPSDSSSEEIEKPSNNNNVLPNGSQLNKINLKNFGRRRKFAKFINGIFTFFLAIGITAALLAAAALYLHGPSMT